jgi:hypothetical protein
MIKAVKGTDLLILSYPIPFFKYFYNCQVVTILHDLYPFEYPENFGFPVYILNRFLFYINLFNTNGYICVSDTTKNSLLKRFKRFLSKKKLATIHNYIPSYKGIVQNPEINVSPNEFWLCVAQHRKNKNIDSLIRVFYKCLSEEVISKKVKLVVVGSNGPSTASLQHLVKDLSLKGTVMFVSNLNIDQLQWLYKYNSLFIMPSSIEGFGMPLIEASKNSCKIVASDIPIFKELVDNIFYFDVSESIDLSLFNSIKVSLSNNYRKPMLNEDLSAEIIYYKFNKFLSDL